jgi:hypothetical protein
MELKELIEKLNEFRSSKSFGNENKIFTDVECQILLEHRIQTTAGNESGNSKSYKEISRQSDELNLGMLKQYLLWLMSAKRPMGGWKDTEKKTLNDNFEIFDQNLLGIGSVKSKELTSDIKKDRQTLIRAGIEKEYISKMNSSIFWNAYKYMSENLEKTTDASKEEHTIKALEKLKWRVIEKYKPKTADELKSEGYEPKKDDELKIEEWALKDFIKESAEEREENFKEFISDFNKTDQKDQSGITRGLEEKNYRWKYESTIHRGIYDTKHCFIERNILARCLFLINGINPYYKKTSPESVIFREDSPLQKGIFELEALVSFMETRVARWKAQEYFCGAMEQNCKSLKNVIKVFKIYLRLHNANSEISGTDKKNRYNIKGTLYKADELISLNQLAFITGLKKATIQNFAKSYEEDEELLVSVPKSKINKEDQNLYKSRCFDVKSVVMWIKKKQYDIKDSAIVSMIPLKLIDLDKKVDMGLLEILNP